MASLDDLVARVGDQDLRRECEVAIADLKRRQRFGLVFEEHIPEKLNSWETRVVKAELARDDLVGWLRNPDRKQWSLRIPYTLGGERHPLYPDFLFVRSTSSGLVVDLLDPHRPDLEDAAPKAVGLAEYADKHWHLFGRIESIIVEKGEIRRLDLTDEQTRGKVKMVQTSAQLRQLFEEAEV